MARGIALVVLLALLGLTQPAGGLSPHAQPIARAAGSLTFSLDAPVAGQTGKFRAKVPAKGRRPIQLQRLVSGSWKVVATKRTSRTGGATFSVTVPAKRSTYRAFAPRVSSKDLRAATTNKVVIEPRAPEAPVPGTLREIGVGEYPFISADGNEVVYTGRGDITFAAWFHRTSPATDQMIASPAMEPVISGDGTTVLFSKGGTGFWDPSWGLTRWDTGAGEGTTVWAERTDEESPWTEFYPGGLSADGAYGSFVAAPSTEDALGLYLLYADGSRDRIVDTSTVLNDIAPDGSCLTFDTDEALVAGDVNETLDAYVWIRATGAFVLVSRAANGDSVPGPSANASASAGCSSIAYERKGRFGQWEVHLWDRTTGDRRLLSRGTEGQSSGDNSHASISADGSQVAFESTASLTMEKDTGNYDLYLWSRDTGGLTLLTPKADVGAGLHPEISDDGRHVAFDGGPVECPSPCDLRVYVWDRTD